MNKTSIYEMIKANIGEDGKLSRDFSLDEPTTPNQICYAPGAMDGIGVYHMGAGNPDKEAVKIVKLIKKYLQTDKMSYINEIEAVLADTRTISVVDPILQNIKKDHKGIEPQKIVEFGFNLAKESGNTELVKLGISLLGLFDLGKYESIKNLVAILSLYDEFTLFSVVAVLNWSNGNDLVFWIANHVDGWGKVHAVERLEPEDEIIKDWILREGCSNGVMDAYLGLNCAVKGDLISALRRDSMDDELFDSISIIIDALLDEGPVSGISEYEHAKEALILYLNHAKKHTDNLKRLWHILNIQSWAEDAEIDYKDEIMTLCADIINKPGWTDKIIAEIEQRGNDFFCACNAASRMDVDVSAPLLAAIKENPLEYCSYTQRLFSDPNMASEIIALYETILPLNEMAEGMGDYFFAETLRKEHGCLDFILPELAAYPMQGVKLINAALNSRVVRERNMACKALSGWVKKNEKPLSEISPEINAELKRIYDIEINKDTKEYMKKLLDGGTLGDDF